MHYKNLLSIIVPAYNSEKFIKSTIRSIQEQTYKNLDIIIINDGSTDNTENICKQISETDGRIRIISIDNSGVSHARNIGLENAYGSIVTFVDSDDTVDSLYFEELIDLYEKEKADCIIAGCNIIKNDNINDKHFPKETGKFEVLSNEKAIESLCYMKRPYELINISSVWGKLFSKELALSSKFNEDMTIGEDFVYNFQVFQNARRIVIADISGYNYFVRTSSTMNSKFKEKDIKNIHQLQLMIDKIDKYRKDFISRSINIAFVVFCMLPLNNEFSVYKGEMIHFIKKYRMVSILNSKTRLKVRLSLLLSLLSFEIVHYLQNNIIKK